MAHASLVKDLVGDFAGRSPMRTTSLIITVFGDTVSQHGGDLWLGSLVRALKPFGVSDRLVRTSVFRLVQDGWLEFQRAGRRSFYAFTDYGSHEYERAARRIYAHEDVPWNQHWLLLVPHGTPDEIREQFKRSLHWQGFRGIAAGMYAKPGAADHTLYETLDEFDMSSRVLIMTAETLPHTSMRLLRRVVSESWNLDTVARDYREYLERYTGLFRDTRAAGALAPHDAFIARTLMIHDYRRILLKDAQIPEALLPRGWPGAKAKALTAATYRALAKPSEDYVVTQLETEDGLMPVASAAFAERFGGLHNA